MDIKPIIALIAVAGLTGCAAERIVLPDQALLPASAPTPDVGQIKLWCSGENDLKTCDHHSVSILSVNENGCVETRSGKDEYIFCLNDGPYFVATRWKGPSAGEGSRTWTNTVGELWPLKTGIEYSFQENGTNSKGVSWSRPGKLNVVGVERITVPAGTFETYRIEITIGDERHYLINYAPSLESTVAVHQLFGGEHKAYYLMALVEPTS